MEDTSVEDLWQTCNMELANSTEKHIPHKTVGRKNSNPRITPELRKLMKKTDRKYRRMKKQRTEELKAEMRTLRSEIQKKLHRAYWDHVGMLFTPIHEEEDTKPSVKRFWAITLNDSDLGNWSSSPQGRRSSHNGCKSKG